MPYMTSIKWFYADFNPFAHLFMDKNVLFLYKKEGLL